MGDAPQPTDGDDDFGVRLEWPIDPIGEPYEPAEEVKEEVKEESAHAAPPAAELPPSAYAPPVPAAVPSMATLVESLSPADMTTLAVIAARIDVLTATTNTFRNHLADRISQTEAQISELLLVQRGLSDDGTRVGPRLDALESAVVDVVSTLAEVHALVARIEPMLTALSDDLGGLRRRVALRARSAPVSDDQVTQIAEAVAALLATERPPPARTRRPPRPR